MVLFVFVIMLLNLPADEDGSDRLRWLKFAGIPLGIFLLLMIGATVWNVGGSAGMTGAHDETKWAPLTTEFWAMVVLIVVILIAAAISNSLNDVRAWTLVTVVGTGYILSRGIAKAGVDRLSRSGRSRP